MQRDDDRRRLAHPGAGGVTDPSRYEAIAAQLTGGFAPHQPQSRPVDVVQCCAETQQMSFVPCDVDRLRITVIKPEPSAIYTWISTFWRSAPPAAADGPVWAELAPLSGAGTGPVLAGELGRNEAGFEITAPTDPAKRWWPGDAKAPVKVRVQPTVAAGPCGMHGQSLALTPPPGVVPGPSRRALTAPAEFEVWAEPMLGEDSVRVTSPFAFFALLYGEAPIHRRYAIDAKTCGNRHTCDSVTDLGCTLDVYPEALVTFELTMPPWWDQEAGRGGDVTRQKRADGAVVRSRSSTSSHSTSNPLMGTERGGSSTSSTLSATRPDGSSSRVAASKRETSWTGTHRGERFAATGTTTGSDVRDPGFEIERKPATPIWHGFAIAIAYNDIEIGGGGKDWAPWIKAMKSLRTFLGGIDRLRALLSQVQLGWQVTGTVKAMEGSVKLSYGVLGRAGQLRVGRHFRADLTLLLIEAGAELSFGLRAGFGDRIKMDSDDWSVLADVRLILELKGAINMAGAYEQVSGAPVIGRAVTVTGSVDLAGKIVVAFGRVISAEGSCTGGVEVAGEWAASVEDKPKLELEGKVKKVETRLKVTSCGMKVFSAERELIEEAALFDKWDFYAPAQPKAG